jgi:hypothetical protein
VEESWREGRHTDSRHGGERETVALRMGAGATPRSTRQAGRHRRRRRLRRCRGNCERGGQGRRHNQTPRSSTMARFGCRGEALDHGGIWAPRGMRDCALSRPRGDGKADEAGLDLGATGAAEGEQSPGGSHERGNLGVGTWPLRGDEEGGGRRARA